jgi:hypothetical protein
LTPVKAFGCGGRHKTCLASVRYVYLRPRSARCTNTLFVDTGDYSSAHIFPDQQLLIFNAHANPPLSADTTASSSSLAASRSGPSLFAFIALLSRCLIRINHDAGEGECYLMNVNPMSEQCGAVKTVRL